MEGGVMAHNIAERSKHPLFLPRPEGDLDGTPRLDVQFIQNPHGFHCNHDARAIIGCSSSCEPAVQVSAHDYDFVLQLRVGACNFGNRVESSGVLIVETGFDSELHLDRYFMVDKSAKAIPSLSFDHFLGDQLSPFRLKYVPSE